MTLNADGREDAVSPVIGAILMIAVTVLIAAVVGAFVFGLVGGVQKMKVVALTAHQMGNSMVVTYKGGQNDGDLTNLSVRFLDNETVFWYDADTAGSYLNTDKDQADKPDIGDSMTASGGTTGLDHIVVTAEFMDGTAQVVLDTYV